MLLLSGQIVSFLGSQVQLFALPLLVLAVSGSASQAGLVLGLGTFSWLTFGLVAGAWVDRWDRRRTMILCDVGRALITVTVPLALWWDRLTVVQLGIVAILNSVLETIFRAANSAALVNVVGVELLPRAMGYFETATNTLRIGGSLVAGALYSAGRAVPFLVDTISFAVSAVTLRFIRVPFQEKSDQEPGRVLADVRTGLRWLWNQRLIRFLTLVSTGDALRYGAGYLLIITLAQRVGASPSQIGFIFTGAAVGAVVGSALSGRLNERYPLGRIAVVTLWVQALTFPLYAFAPNAWVLAAVAAAESVMSPVLMVSLSSYRLAITPDHLRGRTSSAVQTLTMTAMAAGALVGGFLISSIGPRNATFLFAGWLGLMAVLTIANPLVRRSASSAVPTAAAGGNS